MIIEFAINKQWLGTRENNDEQRSPTTSKPDALLISNLCCLIRLRKDVGNEIDIIINLQIKMNY